MIRDLEAKVSLLLDDLFYTRAEIAKMPSDIYLCPPTSENDYEGLKWCDAYEELERENAALRTVLKRWLKVADDCHQEQQEVGYSEYNITVGLVCDTRALLDAARKEAQP